MSIEKYNTFRSIYLADDDQDDRELFVEALREVDPSILLTQARDGMQLMDILNSMSDPIPEVLFLDINMPGKSGLECLAEIRKKQGTVKHLNIIILSTSNDPANIEKALELGANFYAVKPSCYEVLKTFLSEVLQIEWQRTENRQKKFRLI